MGGLKLILTCKTPRGTDRASGVLHAIRLFYYLLRDTLRATGDRSTRTSASSLKRHLNVRTATLRVGHLARGLYATVTTRIHSTGPPPFSVMPLF